MKPSLFKAVLGSTTAIILALSACDSQTDPALAAAPVTAPTLSTVPAQRSAAWVPSMTDTWQWQLAGAVHTDRTATVVGIDLFDADPATIAALHANGKKVLCHFSAGSADIALPDFASFDAADMGGALDDRSGEVWLDTGSENVRSIMQKRLDHARDRHCDGVVPDHVDAYSSKSGFTLTHASQLSYNRFLAMEAHARGLAVGLKNDVGQLAELVNDVDFAVNEQCHQYGECARYAVFVKAGKPVLNVEYAEIYRTEGSDREALCAEAQQLGLETLVLAEALDDSFRYACAG